MRPIRPAPRPPRRRVPRRPPSSLGEQAPVVTVRSVSGSPAAELIKAGAGADLLVVGARGSGGFARLLMGSVSAQVTHHAPCPVVIVPGLAHS